MLLTTVFPKPPPKYAGYGFYSRPPRDHEQCVANRRCRRTPSGDKIRCKNWRTKGSKKGYCAFHARMYERRPKAGTAAIRSYGPDQYGAAYSVYLSESLNERLESLADKSPVELIDLGDELRLAKSTIADAATFYDMMLLAYEQADTPEKKLAALQGVMLAGKTTREVINEVGTIAGQAAGAMAAMKSFIGVQDIPVLVGQIIEAVHEELGDDDPEQVKRIAHRIRDIKLPSNGPTGTDITPDQDVIEMDETVPRVA